MAFLFVTVGRPGELRCERFDCIMVAKGTPQVTLLHWHEAISVPAAAPVINKYVYNFHFTGMQCWTVTAKFCRT